MIPHISPLQDDDAPNSINIPSQNRRRPGFTKEMVLAGLTIKSGTSAWDISHIDYLKHTLFHSSILVPEKRFPVFLIWIGVPEEGERVSAPPRSAARSSLQRGPQW